MGLPGVDTIQIAGKDMPGQWILQPTAREFALQLNKGTFQSGGSVVPIGDEFLVASFLIKIWTAEQYDLFVELANLYLKKPVVAVAGGLSAYALSISHPELSRLGVTSFVVKKSPALTNNGKGLWTGVAEFVEYRKAVPAVGKPNAAIPSAATAVPTAKDKMGAAILAKIAQRDAARGP